MIIDNPNLELVAKLRVQLDEAHAARQATADDAARGIADAQTLLAAADRGLQRIAEALDLPLDAGVNRICAEIARLRCR